MMNLNERLDILEHYLLQALHELRELRLDGNGGRNAGGYDYPAYAGPLPGMPEPPVTSLTGWPAAGGGYREPRRDAYGSAEQRMNEMYGGNPDRPAVYPAGANPRYSPPPGAEWRNAPAFPSHRPAGRDSRTRTFEPYHSNEDTALGGYYHSSAATSDYKTTGAQASVSHSTGGKFGQS